MRKSGIWHPRLIEVIASMGHTDTLVLADAGLPVPPSVECIDLLWASGRPALVPVLTTVLGDLFVDEVTIATQLEGSTLQAITGALQGLPVRSVDHADFKRATERARAVVRTGETAAYSNVILHAGVVR